MAVNPPLPPPVQPIAGFTTVQLVGTASGGSPPILGEIRSPSLMAVAALASLDVETAARRAVDLLAADKSGSEAADVFTMFLQQKKGINNDVAFARTGTRGSRSRSRFAILEKVYFLDRS